MTSSEAGTTKVHFLFSTWTSHTTKFDQWHNLWKFFDRSGRQVGALNTIDGPRMQDADVFYNGDLNISMSMSADDWHNLGTVLWTGSC